MKKPIPPRRERAKRVKKANKHYRYPKTGLFFEVFPRMVNGFVGSLPYLIETYESIKKDYIEFEKLDLTKRMA